MSRRYFIPLAPIEHINGKVENTKVKCPNTYDPESVYNSGYFYGYRRKNNPNKSCFAIRHNGRNLNSNPYTDSELVNRGIFTVTLNTVQEHLSIKGERLLCLNAFNQQRRYTTLRGFAIAMVRANNGVWLPEWTL